MFDPDASRSCSRLVAALFASQKRIRIEEEEHFVEQRESVGLEERMVPRSVVAELARGRGREREGEVVNEGRGWDSELLLV